MSSRQRRRRAKRVRHAPGRRLAVGTSVALGAAFAAPAVGHANTFDVSSTADTATSGTLRTAINNAQSNPGPDVITFSTVSGSTISLGSTLPTISQPLTITGPGANYLTIDGPSNARILSASMANKGDPLTITGLTLTGGNASSTSYGGAIYAKYTALTVDHSVISGNQAGSGGGLATYKGSLNITNTYVHDNIATGTSGGGGGLATRYTAVTGSGGGFGKNHADNGDGGGIEVSHGSPSLRYSDIYLNQGHSGGGIRSDTATIALDRMDVHANTALSGGGLSTRSSGPASVTISNSTLGSNHATSGSGGGGDLRGTPVSIAGSTIDDNDTSSQGGGVILGNHNSTATIANSTIFDNHALGSGGGGLATYSYAGDARPVAIDSTTISHNDAAAGGGGIDVTAQSSGAAVPGPTILNSIVGNDSSTSGGADLERSGVVGPLEGAFTLVESPPAAGVLTETVLGSDILGQDPKLATVLDTNGGPTPTLDLEAGSPAIDSGSTRHNCDQRGFTRPIDTAVANSTAAGADVSDMGAVESGSSVASSCGLEPLPSPPAPGVPQSPAGGAPAVGKLTVSRARAGHNSVSFRLNCTVAACNGKGVLDVLERLKGRKIIGLQKIRRKRITVGSKIYSLSAGQTKKITIKLNGKGKKLLRRFKKMPVRLVVSEKQSTGKSQVVKSKKLRIKAARKKKH